MTGQRFGRLTVQERALHHSGRGVAWLVLCDCGETRIVAGSSLRSGNTRSCGCLQREVAASTARAANFKHGISKTPTWRSWSSMMWRCNSPRHNAYGKSDGSRLTVCERWKDYLNFLEDMGERPVGATIDRIENSKGYEPGNCRWATRKTQNRNRTISRFLTFNGQTKCLAEWAEELNISARAISRRLQWGWDVDRALTEPVLPGQTVERRRADA